MRNQSAVNSPCVSKCVLNEDDICEGCYRSAIEITDWVMYSDEEKLAVIKECSARLKELNKHLKL